LVFGDIAKQSGNPLKQNTQKQNRPKHDRAKQGCHKLFLPILPRPTINNKQQELDLIIFIRHVVYTQ